ncbi:MAG: single-stranded DNA-binding protein [Candidatus Latescibacteria bacterium]|nr:single-stranded DNA-binding protein [Candidatus Latescibacterota bacterium]
MSQSALDITRALSRAVGRCRFAPPVHQVYNPLDYAWEAHSQYLKRYCLPHAQILLLGMNPGPFGMVQTGVPFGEVALVRDWLDISSGVEPPLDQHPKRPIEGFACTRSEVSGQRLWGWARQRFVTPEAFFQRFFVWNYCPLAFMEESGRNRTPDKLPPAERAPLYQACDQALAAIVAHLAPELVLGVGKYGEQRARTVLGDSVPIASILHPSPASPAANRGWAAQVEKQLADLGVELPQ